MKNLLILVALLATVMCTNSCGYTDRVRARSDATIAEANARQKEADSAAQIAQSDATIANMKTLADAAKSDNTVLILVILGGFVVGGLFAYWYGKTAQTNAQTVQAVIMAQLPQQTYQALPEPPTYVRIAARHWQGKPQWDGEYWQIVDSAGRLLASERNQLQAGGD